MRYTVAHSAARIELVRGNIVDQAVDAVVNAANRTLLGGGGVDGAIHRAAGPELLAACRALAGCPTGEARITPGFRLRARHVIHAVGPVYHDEPEDAERLASAYRASLALAEEHALRSVAFPSISTGAYGYPVDEAAPIALGAVAEHLAAGSTLELVRFVLFDEGTLAAYAAAARGLLTPISAQEEPR